MPKTSGETSQSLVDKVLGWISPPWPLSWHLGALVASVALPALILAAYLVIQQQREELLIVERDALARVEVLSNATDASVIAIATTLRAIGANPAIRNGDFTTFIAQTEASFGEGGIAVALRDDKLNILQTTQIPAAPVVLGERDDIFARESLNKGVWRVSNFSVAPDTNLGVIHIWVPLTIVSQPPLLLDATVPVTLFNATLSQSPGPEGWNSGISDRDDRFIANSENSQKFVGQLINEDARNLTVEPKGIIGTVNSLGLPMLQAYHYSELTGWRLSTWAPRSFIEEGARAAWMSFAVMAAALAALSAASAWLWASRMSATVSDLAKSARLLQSDELLEDKVTPIVEVNTLRDTISVAAAELVRRKAELAFNEERLRLALAAGGMGVWEWDTTTDLTHWDEAMFRMTGFPQDGPPISGKTYISRIHPEDARRVEAAISAAVEKDQPLSIDYRFSRPDGIVRWFSVRGAKFCRTVDARNPRFMGVHFDISNDVETAARTRSLLLEVSHRSKNLLAVILAITRLTAREAKTVQAYERALSIRVGALSASQDLIVASDWRGVDLKALVSSQLNAVWRETAVRTIVSGPEITLNPTAAQNLGMAIIELALNAIEHGALANDTGIVKVSWTLSSAAGADKMLLTWVETGGPPVAPVKRRGYGLSVVERLVAQSLKAKAVMSFDTEGVTWELAVPLEVLAANIDYRAFVESK